MKLVIYTIIVCIPLCLFSQSAKFGVKGGINFVNNPKVHSSITAGDFQELATSQKTGFHLGLFSQISLIGFYLRPELYYNRYKTEISQNPTTFSIENQRIDLPVLIGKQFAKVVFIHAGLVGSFYFKEKVDFQDFQNIKQDDVSLAFQIGSGINLGGLTMELRFEQAFSETQILISSALLEYEVQTNPSQFLFSLGYKF